MDASHIDPEIRARIGERIVRGPFGEHLDFELVHLAVDECTVRLPFRPSIANGVGVIHGGAISALVDTSAVGAAWASPDSGPRSRGATVGLNVSYLEPGQTADLLGQATVVRRGRAICIVEVDVIDADERHIARGTVTYRLRQARADEPNARAVLDDTTSGHDAP